MFSSLTIVLCRKMQCVVYMCVSVSDVPFMRSKREWEKRLQRKERTRFFCMSLALFSSLPPLSPFHLLLTNGRLRCKNSFTKIMRKITPFGKWKFRLRYWKNLLLLLSFGQIIKILSWQIFFITSYLTIFYSSLLFSSFIYLSTFLCLFLFFRKLSVVVFIFFLRSHVVQGRHKHFFHTVFRTVLVF